MEIERKFLVVSEAFKNQAEKKEKIVQAYLNSHPERTVRVRTKGEKAYITIKGKSSENGLSRFEWEKEIAIQDAENLLKLAEPEPIEKLRYEVKIGQHTFEVDEFSGSNKGLIVAEVELNSEDEKFEKPEWLGKEVTGNKRYYNSLLSKNPYKNWEE
ncbi:CYTH domain-containing protein [Zunongwangia sp. F363]|uniref:CYTH domain-containing protein n=1 Tax=Autumnicola tepida TaxID=3075595 RepID=A0ABU3CBA6_9FLAO|nr:CYTH domain-containing protein [Zunongwangia sp. F363]MDT0643623.1 CYTH domain-containing protein [Zunongwangia sp. F363]